MKRNVPVIGLILGLIMPIIGVSLMYLVMGPEKNYFQYIEGVFTGGKSGAKVLSLSLLLELVPFLYFTNRRMDYAARGVLVATMIYAVVILLLMYVW